jgi:hypothetical protein
MKATLLFALLSAGGCNPLVCGPGTLQAQEPSGEVRCVPAEAAAATVPCDVDGGAIIVGGVCTTRVVCDGPSTMAVTLPDGHVVCVGTGGGEGCTARTPDADKISITGDLYEWETGAKSKKKVKFAAYEPLGFLGGARTPLGSDENEKGCYAIDNIVKPGSNLVAMAVDDPEGASDELLLGGAGATVMVAGRIYKVDLYTIKRQTVEAWKQQTGLDYVGLGVYVGCYYGDPPPAATENTMKNATMPVSGVQITENGVVPANAKYLSSPTMVGTGTSTSANGCALLPAPANISLYGGMGGMCRGAACNWKPLTGASTPQVAFFARFFTM